MQRIATRSTPTPELGIKKKEEAKENGTQSVLSKYKWRIVIIIIILAILLAIVSFLWDRINKNRRFNRVQRTMGRDVNPMLLNPEQNLVTYYKPSANASPVFRNSTRYQYDDNLEMIGLDLEKLRPGDVILTRYLRAQDKPAEVSLLKRLFPDRANSFGKWPSKGGLFRGFKRKFNVEAAIQAYVGQDVPTHAAIVGRIKSLEEGERLAPKHIVIWEMTIDTARAKLTLADFIKKHPCTLTQYWILHLNSSAPPAVIDLVDHYFDNVYKPTMRTSLAFDYVKRGRGTCLANRKLFFHALNTSKASSVPSRFSGKTMNSPKLPALEPYIRTVGSSAPEPRILVSAKNRYAESILIEDEVDKDAILDSSWTNWGGMEHGCYTCSVMVYAELEAYGLTLNMSDRFAFLKIPSEDGSTAQLTRANVAHVAIDDCLARASEIMAEQGVQKTDETSLVREWQSEAFLNPTSRIRIMAPQFVTPCDYLRSDFQWADGVYVRFASRVYFVQ